MYKSTKAVATNDMETEHYVELKPQTNQQPTTQSTFVQFASYP